MKKWIVLVAVLGIGFGGYSFWNWRKTKQVAVVPDHPSTAVIEPRTINFAVNAAGDIGPNEMVSVRPEINGRLSELPVDIGDYVTKGSLLCTLDDRDLQTERSTQLTSIEGAKLTVEKTRRNYERSKQLAADKLISQEVFDDTLTEYDLARNALERARRSLTQVEDQLSKTRIVAPFDCTILTRPVSIGQAVSGSGGFNSGTEIMSIANLKDMIINAHMNQADVTQLKAGQPVDVEVEAVPGLKMTGVVERIAPQATIKNNIKGFATKIRLQEIDPRVRPGMTANMTIPLLTADNVVAIPISAVFTEEGERYVYVQSSQDGAFEARPIQIGLADFQYAQVLSGLTNGNLVSLVRPPDAPPLKSRAQNMLADRTNGSGDRNRAVMPAVTGSSGTNAPATNRPAAPLAR